MASRRDDGGGAGESGQGLLGEILGSLTLASTSASSDTASVSTADGGDGGDGFGVDGWFANPAGEGESAFNPFGGEGGNRNSFIPTTQTQTHRVQTMGSQGTGTDIPRPISVAPPNNINRYSINPFDAGLPGDRRSVNPFDLSNAQLQLGSGSRPTSQVPSIHFNFSERTHGLPPPPNERLSRLSMLVPHNHHAPASSEPQPRRLGPGPGPVLHARPISTVFLPADLSNGFAPPLQQPVVSLPPPPPPPPATESSDSIVLETPSELVANMSSSSVTATNSTIAPTGSGVSATASRHTRRATGNRALDGLRRMVGLGISTGGAEGPEEHELEGSPVTSVPTNATASEEQPSAEGNRLVRVPSWTHRRLGSLRRAFSNSPSPSPERRLHRRTDSYSTLVGSPQVEIEEPEMEDARWQLPDLLFFSGTSEDEPEEPVDASPAGSAPGSRRNSSDTTPAPAAAPSPPAKPAPAPAPPAKKGVPSKEGYEEKYDWPVDDTAVQKHLARQSILSRHSKYSRDSRYLDYGTADASGADKEEMEWIEGVDSEIDLELADKEPRRVPLWLVFCVLLGIAGILASVGAGVFLGNTKRDLASVAGGAVVNGTTTKTRMRTPKPTKTALIAPAPTYVQVGGKCTRHGMCGSGCCGNGTCAAWETCQSATTVLASLVETGKQCTADASCKSGCCNDGLCAAHEVCFPVPVLLGNNIACDASLANGNATRVCQSGCCFEGACRDARFCEPVGLSGKCEEHGMCESGCCGEGMTKCVANEVCFPPATAPLKELGAGCAVFENCKSGCCSGGKCAAYDVCYPPPPQENGAYCTGGSRCLSGCCAGNNTCAPWEVCHPAPPPPPPAPVPEVAQSGTRGNPAPLNAWCDGYWESCQTGCCQNNVCKAYETCRAPPPPPPPPAAPSLEGWISGQATYYHACDPAQNHGWSCMGACDNRITDDPSGPPLVALNIPQYNRGMCNNQCIMIFDVQRGQYGTFRVADACYACGWGNIDFTMGALSVFGRNQYDGASGVFPIRWKFC